MRLPDILEDAGLPAHGGSRMDRPILPPEPHHTYGVRVQMSNDGWIDATIAGPTTLAAAVTLALQDEPGALRVEAWHLDNVCECEADA